MKKYFTYLILTLVSGLLMTLLGVLFIVLCPILPLFVKEDKISISITDNWSVNYEF